MAETHTTVRQIVETFMVPIPEGLELPYLLNKENRDNHLLLLIPDGSINTAWWTATINLSRTTKMIKAELVNNLENLIEDTTYKYCLQKLKAGECKLYLWRVTSTVELNKRLEMLKKHLPRAQRRFKTPGIAMESWGVTLKDHPEFTCIISLDPSQYAHADKAAISRAIRFWKSVYRENAPQTGPRKRLAHTEYARRNKEKLINKEGFTATKLASYSSYAVFKKFRIAELSDWVTPTKLLKSNNPCVHYNSSGATTPQDPTEQ